MKTIRIGGGAGYAGDRIDAAVELINGGKLDYVIFECLAERTIGLCQQEVLSKTGKGYSRLTEERLRRTLKPAMDNGVKIISNLGAADPRAAAELIIDIAREQGLSGIKLAYITGDNIFDHVESYYDCDVLEFDGTIANVKERLISANAYCGSEGIVEALKNGANIVITGRVSDPSLTVGPLCYEYGWTLSNNPDQLGQSILAGHLLECGHHCTGGFFADPPYKTVPDMERMGFPIAQFDPTGTFTISKVDGSGGLITFDTIKEQILYEVHDPSAYITPDATADFSHVRLTSSGANTVTIQGATTHGMPERLKANFCYKDSWTCDCGITYGGTNCLTRAKLAAETVLNRFKKLNIAAREIRVDYIGFNSLYKDKISSSMLDENHVFPEIRLRICVRTDDYLNAKLARDEWDAIYCSGPSAGGGATMYIEQIINVCSTFVPREDIVTAIGYMEV